MKLALLLVFVPALAAAQMPDPRQMSGHPRPDQAVPAGVLTVKVIRGDLGALAPAGTIVHLVGVAAGGQVTARAVAVNDQGRAEFKDLAVDGKVVYYALSLFDGDRLESDPITMPPRVGVRLMLSGRKVEDRGKPAIDDEAQSEEGAVAAGSVELSVRGPGGDNQAVLRELAGGTAAPQPLDENARGTKWGGIAGGPDKVYIVELPNGSGKKFYTAPFLLSDKAGVRRMILAYDKLLLAVQGGAQVDDADLAWEVQLVIANLTGVPFDAGPDGLLIPLPKGFRGANLKDDDPGGRLTVVPGEGVLVRGVIAPGQKEVVVQFLLGADDGRAAVEMPAPLGIFQSQLFIAKTPQMVITPGTGVAAAPKIERADDGREYFHLADVNIKPDEVLRFEISGLPVPPRWQAVSRAFVGLIVIALVVAAFAFAVSRPSALSAAKAPATRDGERRELIAQRERLYAELVNLERARVARKIDLDIFASKRRGIMTRLVLVHRQLDDLEGPQGERPAT